MDPRQLFDENLALIDRIVGRVCAKAGLKGADAEDFASDVRVALLDDDCAILREWEQRASLATYLIVIVQRLYADARRQIAGKWRPSAEARRSGEAAVTLERLVHRNGRTLDEALPAARAIDPSLTRDDARALMERLPERAPRPRLVALDPELDVASHIGLADARAAESEARRLSERTAAVVRAALRAMPLEDRIIVRFRFGSGMTIADVARMLEAPQRPLYRRIESILDKLRRALRAAAIDPREIEELIGSPVNAMDFGFWKNTDAGPANEMRTKATPDTAGEQS